VRHWAPREFGLSRPIARRIGIPEPLGKRHAPAFAPIRQSAAVDPASLLSGDAASCATPQAVSRRKRPANIAKNTGLSPQARHLEVLSGVVKMQTVSKFQK
jgi:hypothetical protein